MLSKQHDTSCDCLLLNAFCFFFLRLSGGFIYLLLIVWGFRAIISKKRFWNVVQVALDFCVLFVCEPLFWKANLSAWLVGLWNAVWILFMNKCSHWNVDLHASSVCSLDSTLLPVLLFSSLLFFGKIRWTTWWCHCHHHHRRPHHWSGHREVNALHEMSIWTSDCLSNVGLTTRYFYPTYKGVLKLNETKPMISSLMWNDLFPRPTKSDFEQQYEIS